MAGDVMLPREEYEALKAVVEAAQEVRTGLGLTAYEGTPVSVWSAKHYEKLLADALAALTSEQKPNG
jgi:hypothetical protein